MEVIAREPRANAAFLRLPRSGNHHDLGLFLAADVLPVIRRETGDSDRSGAALASAGRR